MRRKHQDAVLGQTISQELEKLAKLNGIDVRQERAAPDQVERAPDVNPVDALVRKEWLGAEQAGAEFDRGRIDIARRQLSAGKRGLQHPQHATKPGSEIQDPAGGAPVRGLEATIDAVERRLADADV